VDPALADYYCQSSVTVGEDGLTFDLRNCRYNDRLFSCVTPPATAAAIAANAHVNCGCGCGDCPTAPALCTTTQNGTSCSTPESPAPALVHREAHSLATVTVTESPASETSVVSSTSFCGTCCNMDELGQLSATSEVPYTELLVRLNAAPDGDCLFCDSYVNLGPDGYGAMLACIVDHGGVTEHTITTSCEGHGSFEFGPGEVIRARGLNFEPIAPLPTFLASPPQP